MPDIAVVFGNGAVAGEEACLGDVHKALLAPAQRVAGVIAQGLPLAHNIGIEVRQGLEPVLADQLIVQAGQVFGVSSASSSYMVRSRSSWMSKGASLAPQEIRMDFAVLPAASL